MFKQSPSRNHRTKGIKVKHILQICVLVAVCFWLIYQVRHSHEKKKELDAKDANIAAVVESTDGIIRFGRKDLPRVEIATKDEKHAEDEEENEAEEEENRHDKDELEREEIKATRREEEEDVSRGGGDDEIDEHDQESNEVEAEHEEEFIDEEKEREEDDDEKSEENEDRGGEGDAESDNVQEDRDHDAGSRNTHEAREEHYKGDDASSEVAHDSQIITAGTVTMLSENTNEKFEVSDSGKDNETNTSDGVNVDKSASSLQLTREGEVAEHGGSSNATAVEDRNNSAAAYDRNTSFLFSDTSQTTSNLTKVQNAAVEHTAADKGHTLQTNVSELTNSDKLTSEKIRLEMATSSNSSEYVDATVGKLLNSLDNTTAEIVKDSSENLTDTSTSESKVEAVADRETGRENQSSDSHSTNEDGDTVLHDPIDASDSSFAQEEKESRMDLSTLPDIRDEVLSAEDAAAE